MPPESKPATSSPPETLEQAIELLDREYISGQFGPSSSHAAVAAMLRSAMRLFAERACRELCPYCKDGYPIEAGVTIDGRPCHKLPASAGRYRVMCNAAAIRRLAEEEIRK